MHIFTIAHENCDVTSGSLLVVLGNKEESKQHVLKGSNTKMTYKCWAARKHHVLLSLSPCKYTTSRHPFKNRIETFYYSYP